jgi:mRNA interferase MazF
MTHEFRRGDIWYFDPDPSMGREQRKIRPCLILSIDEYNKGFSDLLIVLPLTTKKKGIPCHIEIEVDGLAQTSYVMCDQIRTISKMRLRNPKGKQYRPERIAHAPAKILDDIERWLTILLGFKL